MELLASWGLEWLPMEEREKGARRSASTRPEFVILGKEHPTRAQNRTLHFAR